MLNNLQRSRELSLLTRLVLTVSSKPVLAGCVRFVFLRYVH